MTDLLKMMKVSTELNQKMSLFAYDLAMNHHNVPCKCLLRQNLGKPSPGTVHGIKASLRQHLYFSYVASLRDNNDVKLSINHSSAMLK